jgi:hypothetical protein
MGLDDDEAVMLVIISFIGVLFAYVSVSSVVATTIEVIVGGSGPLTVIVNNPLSYLFLCTVATSITVFTLSVRGRWNVERVDREPPDAKGSSKNSDAGIRTEIDQTTEKKYDTDGERERVDDVCEEPRALRNESKTRTDETFHPDVSYGEEEEDLSDLLDASDVSETFQEIQ